MAPPPNDDHDHDLKIIDRIYDALEANDPESALLDARRVLAGESDDPVARFLCGLALLELDRAAEAAIELQHAVKLDPDDAEFSSQLASALFRCCRFDEAREQNKRTMELDATLADAHYTRGLLAERAADLDQAEESFTRASELDSECFPRPVRLTDAEFDAAMDDARAFLNDTFRGHLNQVAITVEPLPSDEILLATKPPMDPELLGLFVGVPLSEATNFAPGGELPPRILVFKRNLERTFTDPEELREEIGRTLHHELGHYLGLDEDELEAIGLD